MPDFYKFVLDNLPVCTIIYNQDGKVIYRNKATKIIDGYEDEELLGLTRNEYLTRLGITTKSNTAKTIYPRNSNDKFEDGIFQLKETTLRMKDGSLKNVLLIGNFITDDNRHLIGACGCAVDISTYIRKEKIYQQTLENVISNIPMWIQLYDENNQLILSNLYYEELKNINEVWLGLSRDQVLKRIGIREYNHHLDLFEKVKTSGEIVSSTYWSEAFKKENLYTLIPLKGTDGNTEYILEATKCIKLEKEYQEVEFYLSAVLDMIDISNAFIDNRGNISLVNDKFVDFGLSRDQLLGKNITELPSIFGLDVEIPVPDIKNGEVFEYEFVWCNLSSSRNLLLKVMPIIGNKVFIGAIVVLHDITDIKKNQKKIFEQEKLASIGQMAAGMAHEIKNPLTVIKGYIQLLKEKFSYNQELVNSFNIIIEETDRASNVITEFLQFARPKDPVLCEHSIEKLIDEVYKIVEPQAFLSDITVKHERTEESLPLCKFDWNQIKMVLINLCQNALEAMSSNGTLKIKTGLTNNNEIFIEIIDTGIGIPEQDLKKLGTPFFSTKGNGTGLGLSIVYSIINSHNGYIDVNSLVGRGTSFCIHLPILK